MVPRKPDRFAASFVWELPLKFVSKSVALLARKTKALNTQSRGSGWFSWICSNSRVRRVDSIQAQKAVKILKHWLGSLLVQKAKANFRVWKICNHYENQFGGSNVNNMYTWSKRFRHGYFNLGIDSDTRISLLVCTASCKLNDSINNLDEW